MIMGELGCSEHKVQVHTGEDGCNHQKYGVDDLARLGLGVFPAEKEIPAAMEKIRQNPQQFKTSA